MNLSAVDLNLLVVLEALLSERNATRAARRLGVTQSAVSNALGRLRGLLGDPLFVRHARGLAPTPRAEALAPAVTRALEAAHEALGGAADFDPNTSRRELVLACPDYYGAVMLPPLAHALRQRAPGMRLRVVGLERLGAGGGLADDVDVHVGRPPAVPAGCKARDLFREAFVCVSRRPTGKGSRSRKSTPRTRMPLAEYVAATHVRVQVLDRARDPIDEGLARRGAARSIAVTVPHFALVPRLVLQTGYVATVGERLARHWAEHLPLDVRPAPIALAPRPVRMLWHVRTEVDPAAAFFRELVVAVSRSP